MGAEGYYRYNKIIRRGFLMLYLTVEKSNKLENYAPPMLTIVLLSPTDIITESEVGDEWPWGDGRSITFG